MDGGFMKNSMVRYLNLFVLTTGLVGWVAHANVPKPPDPIKIEKKFDKRDLLFLKSQKSGTKLKIKKQSARKHQIDHRLNKKIKVQRNDVTRLVHRKERLKYVEDKAKIQKLNKKIANTEKRIEKRNLKITKIQANQTAMAEKLNKSQQQLAMLDDAITKKKQEISGFEPAVEPPANGTL
jgi:chromosome segregation ATPase